MAARFGLSCLTIVTLASLWIHKPAYSKPIFGPFMCDLFCYDYYYDDNATLNPMDRWLDSMDPCGACPTGAPGQPGAIRPGQTVTPQTVILLEPNRAGGVNLTYNPGNLLITVNPANQTDCSKCGTSTTASPTTAATTGTTTAAATTTTAATPTTAATTTTTAATTTVAGATTTTTTTAATTAATTT